MTLQTIISQNIRKLLNDRKLRQASIAQHSTYKEGKVSKILNG